jgi:alpha-beta hydrolase superfamily lysophospholipase
MKAIYTDRCFAVLHPAAGTHGVVICNSLGDEALNAYRPLVFLAERFAAAGYPVLRLEYYGAGDSAGEDEEPDRFRAWLDGIRGAVRWLRENCGVARVTLVGVRIGALLAAAAACEMDAVAGLVLLAPAASGRRFLRELILRANATAEIWKTMKVDDPVWFEAHGLRIDQPTRDAIDGLDLARLPRAPAPHMLVVSDIDNAVGGIVAEKLQRLGTTATVMDCAGLDAMLRDPYDNTVPHAAFAHIVDWHASAIAPQPARDHAPMPTVGDCVLLTAHGRETPVWFGPDNSLFGILSEPPQRDVQTPAVLIANYGANPRAGNARGAVMVARWLAAHGVASLRVDGAGIGDSAIETGERGQPYSPEADADLAAAVDELCRQSGSPVLLLGMCSGAYHALRAAYADARIGGLMLLNLQKFTWHTGESLSVVQRTTLRPTRFYIQNLATKNTLRRLITGEISIIRILRGLAGRVGRRIAAIADPALTILRGGETPVGQVRRQVRGLRQRGVPILFMLSGNDPGLDEIAEYFGAQGREFRRQPNVTFHLLEGADHTLSTHWARRTAIGLIGDFLHQQWGVRTGVHAPEVSTPQPAPAEAALTPA